LVDSVVPPTAVFNLLGLITPQHFSPLTPALSPLRVEGEEIGPVLSRLRGDFPEKRPRALNLEPERGVYAASLSKLFLVPNVEAA
jgi:hypothetical protein